MLLIEPRFFVTRGLVGLAALQDVVYWEAYLSESGDFASLIDLPNIRSPVMERESQSKIPSKPRRF